MQYGELISCVTKYKQNLVRIKSDYFSYLSEKQKVEWFAFRILNKVFDNPDKFGEQYLDENSNIYSLDFGESIITSTQNARMVIKNILVDSYHEIIIDNYCEEKFYERLYECRHPHRRKLLILYILPATNRFLSPLRFLYHHHIPVCCT